MTRVGVVTGHARGAPCPMMVVRLWTTSLFCDGTSKNRTWRNEDVCKFLSYRDSIKSLNSLALIGFLEGQRVEERGSRWSGTVRINLDKPVLLLYVAQKRRRFARFRVGSHLPPPRRARCDIVAKFGSLKKEARRRLDSWAHRRPDVIIDSKISLGFSSSLHTPSGPQTDGIFEVEAHTWRLGSSPHTRSPVGERQPSRGDVSNWKQILFVPWLREAEPWICTCAHAHMLLATR